MSSDPSLCLFVGTPLIFWILLVAFVLDPAIGKHVIEYATLITISGINVHARAGTGSATSAGNPK